MTDAVLSQVVATNFWHFINSKTQMRISWNNDLFSGLQPLNDPNYRWCFVYFLKKNRKALNLWKLGFPLFFTWKQKRAKHIKYNKPFLWINLSDVQLGLQRQELLSRWMLKVTYMIYNSIWHNKIWFQCYKVSWVGRQINYLL